MATKITLLLDVSSRSLVFICKNTWSLIQEPSVLRAMKCVWFKSGNPCSGCRSMNNGHDLRKVLHTARKVKCFIIWVCVHTPHCDRYTRTRTFISVRPQDRFSLQDCLYRDIYRCHFGQCWRLITDFRKFQPVQHLQSYSFRIKQSKNYGLKVPEDWSSKFLRSSRECLPVDMT